MTQLLGEYRSQAKSTLKKGTSVLHNRKPRRNRVVAHEEKTPCSTAIAVVSSDCEALPTWGKKPVAPCQESRLVLAKSIEFCVPLGGL